MKANRQLAAACKTLIAAVVLTIAGSVYAAPAGDSPTGAAAAPAFITPNASNRQSRFAHYRGYRKEYFHEYRMESRYVAGSNATRLAVSILRPTKNGEYLAQQLATVVMPDVYGRDPRTTADPAAATSLHNGRIALTGAFGTAEGDLNARVAALLAHGYAVVTVDLPGRGASFGGDYGYVDTRKRQAIWDIVSWTAQQTWSNGRVGVTGLSWNGALTLFSAFAGAPAALNAVFPESPSLLAGGLRSGHLMNWEAQWLFGFAATGEDAREWVIPVHKAHSALPVDEDAQRTLARQALAEQDSAASLLRAKLEVARLFAGDTSYPGALTLFSEPGYTEWVPLVRGLDGLRNSHVAVYIAGGAHDWLGFDLSPYAVMRAAPNESKTVKALVHPGGHGLGRFARTDVRERHAAAVLQTEMVRWFDYWLYGIANGVMDEPRVHVPILNTSLIDGSQSQEVEYVASDDMRLADGSLTLHLSDARTTTAVSHFDGGLSRQPAAKSAEARLQQRWAATLPPPDHQQISRTTPEGEIHYGDLSWRDRQGITFTSAPLTEELIVLGMPRVTLQLRSSAPSALVYVTLEEIDAAGRSDYVAEGFVDTRFSEGSRRTASWDAPDYAALVAPTGAAEPLGSRPREIVLPLSAAYVRFDKGHRIRVAIHSGDESTLWSPPTELNPVQIAADATHVLTFGGSHPSFLELPLLTAARLAARRVAGPGTD